MSNPKQPKKMSTEEWIQLLLDNQDAWKDRLAYVDEEARRIFFSSSGPPLDSNLQFVSVYFYATYMFNFISSLVADPDIGVPKEILEYHSELAEELAQSAYKDSTSHLKRKQKLLDGDDIDPELLVTMKKGDA
jgi:hypothetical protein